MSRALLSAILPGTGQLSGGGRRSGLAMLGVALGLALAAVVVLAARGLYGLLSWAVDPTVLMAIFFLNLFVMVFRLYVVVDAFLDPTTGDSRLGTDKTPSKSHQPPEAARAERRIAGLRVSARTTLAAGLAALILLTAAPHIMAAYYSYTSYDLVQTLFAGNSPKEAATETDDQRVTLLLLGTDAGYQRVGKRADSIMVATFSLQTGRVALFGIPRETGSFSLRGKITSLLGQTFYKNPIGYLYSVAAKYPELAPAGEDPGALVLEDTIGDILGIPIDYYLVINMDGFVQLVDALGGVTVEVTDPLFVWIPALAPGEQAHSQVLSAGSHHLDGLSALEFARSRAGNSDISRMARQRYLLSSVFDQTGAVELAFRFPAIAGVMKRSLETDMPLETLQTLISAWPHFNTDDITSVGFAPPKFTTGDNERGFHVLDLPLVQSTVRQVLDDPDSAGAALQ